MLKNKINSAAKPILILFIIILDLIFLYFIKYNNQSLSISEFNLGNIGNLINLIIYVILLISLSVLYINKNQFWDNKYIAAVFFINQILIVSAYISAMVVLPFSSYYYLGQNGNRLFIGLIFTLYQFTFFITLFLVWLNILKIKNYIFLRAAVYSAILMSIILVISFLFILSTEPGYKNQNIMSNKDNVAVVLGAAVWSDNKPSPSLAARVDKSIEMLNSRIVKEIYLTGSNAPGELSEAEVALKYIKMKGIDSSEIFLEKETTSTNEQIQFIKKKILSKPEKNVIVISDSYHLVRVKEISKFHNIKIEVTPSELSLSFKSALYNKIREALALTVFWFFAI